MKNYLFITVLTLFFLSCSIGSNKNNDQTGVSDSIPNLPVEDATTNNIYTNYKIPLPIDIVNFLSNSKEFKPDLIIPLENADIFSTSISQALNLGIYTADFSYCSILQAGQTTLEYYKLCFDFAKKLEINDGYTEEYLRRLNHNLDNPDSLIYLANETYNRACNNLEQQGRNNILPFVIIGGWYESLSIVIQSGKKGYANKDKVRNFIINQQQGVENLINYLYDVQIETSAFAYHDELENFIKHLKKLKGLYQDYRSSQDTTIYTILSEEILQKRNMITNNAIK